MVHIQRAALLAHPVTRKKCCENMRKRKHLVIFWSESIYLSSSLCSIRP